MNKGEQRINGPELKISLSLLTLSHSLFFSPLLSECEHVLHFSVLLNKLC